MITTKTVIAINPSTPQAGLVVTLEGTNLVLAILISTIGLLGIFAKIVSRFNAITNEIRDLREDLNSHAIAEGHAKLLEQVKVLQKDLAALDKRFDIHLQDYVNHKDAALLALNGNDEKIEHKWERTEELFKEQKAEIKDLQKFLQKHQSFRIRE
ncbi:MAG: hypothetical protein KME50_16145 [Nostoc desertorum CM1-VF14]|jgi:hypothetical protein|nr:hypothetical protein [Nostoc desertorum CM1-VF14]